MAYTVAPVHPADIPHLTAIQWAALGSNPLTQVLYPRGPTPALTAFTTASYERATSFPSVQLINAINKATGEIVGFAKWIIYRQIEEETLHKGVSDNQGQSNGSRRNSGWAKEKHLMPSMPPDCHGMLLNRWGRIINKTRKRITGPRGHACSTGAPCSLKCYFSNFAENLWVLDILHVLPLHQRNGAGTALIDWGLEMADKESLECYVETSPAAHSACVKKGFRHVAEMRIQLGKYKEGYKDYRHVVMIRPPFGREEPPERSEPPNIEDPFNDEGAVSPTDEADMSYTAEAKMLDFRSSSVVRTTVSMDESTSTRSSSRKSTVYRAELLTSSQAPEIG